jgi:2'-5' RNA ligase
LTAAGERRIARAFLACTLPEATTVDLAARLAPLRIHLGEHTYRWVRRSHWHLTLRFFGAVEAVASGALVTILADVARQTTTIRGTLGRPIGLPRWRAATVVALAIDSGGALEALAARLDAALAFALGPADKPFLAHVTIVRMRHPSRRVLRSVEAAFAGLERSRDAFELPAMTLFESELLSDGPRYTALARFPFQKAPS